MVSVVVPLVLLTSSQLSGHHVVVEVNVPGTVAYETVIGNVENLRKAFKGEQVEVEIVCEGRGIDMLLSHGNKDAARIQKLSKAGVKFAACSNTLRGRSIDKKRLFSFVTVVDSGVAEVVRKQEAGWSYLKGAF